MTATQIQLLNFVANQPEVRAAMAPGLMAVDMSGFFDRADNLMFGNEHGLVIFAHLGDGIYEGHYMWTDTLSARAGLRMTRSAIRAVFTKHGARAINGVTPRGNKAARAVNRALGFHPTGSTRDTMGRECIKYTLERELWEVLSAASLAE